MPPFSKRLTPSLLDWPGRPFSAIVANVTDRTRLTDGRHIVAAQCYLHHEPGNRGIELAPFKLERQPIEYPSQADT